LLRTLGLAGAAGASTLAAAADGSSPSGDTAGRSTTAATPSTTANATGTPTGTPTATPTAAVATPTSGWEPTGEVAVPGATEVVLTPDGETAFAAVGDGFAVLDMADSTDPRVVTRVTDISPPDTDRVMGGVYDVKYDDGDLLVAGPAGYDPDAWRGVVRYDVSDPTDPERLTVHETVFPVHNCFYLDGYAYLTGNDGDRNPLVIVDMTDPAAVGRWSVLDYDDAWADVNRNLRQLHDVWVQDGLAYLAYWDAGTWILDVSDPANPDHVGHVLAQSVETLAEKQNLEVYRETVEPPGNVHYVATDPAGDMLAVGKETWNSNAGVDTTPGPDSPDPGGPSGIDLYDVSDPADPAHLATIDPPPTADRNVNGVWTTAHNFEVGSRYLYSAWYQGGVMVHDIADPANPERVRYFRRSPSTEFWTAQLTSPGDAVVASSYVNPQNRDAPARVLTFPDVPRETPTATPTDSPAPTPTATGTATPSPSSTETASDDTTTGASSADGPGFGPLAALAGLGAGAWRLATRGDAGDDARSD
jgi:PGF-CTERM protein